jgi:Protein of unknown function (DUF2752)
MPDNAMATADPGPGGARALLPWLLTGLGLAGAAALLALVLPTGPAGDPRLVFCPSRRLLGLPCPGCGMTRAFAALLRGDLAGALILQPWAPVLAAQLALGWAAWGWSLSDTPSGRLLRPALWLGPALLANLAALIALWLGRLATGSLP